MVLRQKISYCLTDETVAEVRFAMRQTAQESPRGMIYFSLLSDGNVYIAQFWDGELVNLTRCHNADEMDW